MPPHRRHDLRPLVARALPQRADAVNALAQSRPRRTQRPHVLGARPTGREFLRSPPPTSSGPNVCPCTTTSASSPAPAAGEGGDQAGSRAPSKAEHPLAGERILGQNPFFACAPPPARHHHENWDGSGYPDKLPRYAMLRRSSHRPRRRMSSMPSPSAAPRRPPVAVEAIRASSAMAAADPSTPGRRRRPHPLASRGELGQHVAAA